ncbi:uncharacterized protein TNCV_4554461 [Trichonephila clavipes]|nr:uncharacterized protein TNCV_4554461 [Trichonephila clavipes]
MFQILLWSPWKYRCGQRTVRMAVVACSQKQNQAVFARRRIKVKAELKLKKAETLEKKLLDIREKGERESAGTGEYFPPLQFTCRNCGGGDRGRVAIYRPFGEVSLSLNRTVTCMVLKANDRRTSCPCHDEFRGPRSDYVRQVALATKQQHTH